MALSNYARSWDETKTAQFAFLRSVTYGEAVRGARNVASRYAHSPAAAAVVAALSNGKSVLVYAGSSSSIPVSHRRLLRQSLSLNEFLFVQFHQPDVLAEYTAVFVSGNGSKHAETLAANQRKYHPRQHAAAFSLDAPVVAAINSLQSIDSMGAVHLKSLRRLASTHAPSSALCVPPQRPAAACPVRICFVGSAFVFFNDLPRLLASMSMAPVATGACVRNRASLGLILRRGGGSKLFPSADSGQSDALPTVSQLLLGSADRQVGWDYCVLDLSEQNPGTQRSNLAALREGYAPLLGASGTTPVLLAAPAICGDREEDEDEEEEWERNRSANEASLALYRRALDEALAGCVEAHDTEDDLNAAAFSETKGACTNTTRDTEQRGGVGFADPTRTRVANVNGAFAAVRADRPDLWRHLFCADGPSPAGSYLAACVLYTAIFGAAPPTRTAVPVDVSAFFASSRRPLSERPSDRLPTREDMQYLCGLVAALAAVK